LSRRGGDAGRRGAQAIREGVHVCQAWLQHVGAPSMAVFDAERVQYPELAALLAALPSNLVLLAAARLLRQLETVETGQGVLFVVDPPEPALPARLAEPLVGPGAAQAPVPVG